MRVAQDAPAHAPARLPARRFAAMLQWAMSSEAGTAISRAGSAVSTTARLIALLRITAASAAKPKIPMRSGRRNSAPPRPIMPPRRPTAAPAANVTIEEWDATSEATAVRPPLARSLPSTATSATVVLKAVRAFTATARRRRDSCVRRQSP